jgi:hypothetical protein
MPQGASLLSKGLALAAVFALLGFSSSASAVILTGGPVYNLPGGGSCIASGVASATGGATVSCTGINLGAHTRVYLGIKNNTSPNGQTMTGTAPVAGSASIFTYLSNTASSITYQSATTVNDQVNGSQTVSNRLVLTRTGGTGAVVATGGNPANNTRGDIERLFEITSGTTFTVRVDVQASNPFHALGNALPAVYDPTNTPTSGASDISRVDLAFYYSDCGDGQLDSPEQCDLGGANGSPTSCCTSGCQFRGAGELCRAGAGAPCDSNELCTGAGSACPADDAPINSGVVCRTGSGDSCDLNETCTGVPGQGCPADDAPTKVGVICRVGSVGGVCDQPETCTGVPGGTCPADDAPGNLNMVCRTGSGDQCDPDELCTGIPGQGCPADVVANPLTVCRAGSGDSCDPDELCPAIPGQACPADVVQPAATVCRAAADDCDVAEQCSGTALQACPANGFAAASTSCNSDADVCTTDACDGSGACNYVEDLDCDDGSACTQDSCDSVNGCEYSGSPAGTCVSATKATLKYKDNVLDKKDKLNFVWKGGPAVIGDMGDPTQTTDYELCVYDNTGVQLALTVPAGAGWATVGTPGDPRGFKYKDKLAVNDGVKQLRTKASNLDKGQAKVTASKENLPDTATLPFQYPVTAQLFAAGGMCWEAEFDADATTKNVVDQFKAKVK